MVTQESTCSIDECLNQAHSRGWCRTHYSKWYRNGDPLAVKTRTAPIHIQKLCSLDGCDLPMLAKRLCSTHYARARTTGSAGEARIKTYKSPVVDGRKQCGKCSEWKPLADFNKHRHGSGGVESKCRPCQTAHNAAWRSENRDYWQLRATDPVIYEKILAASHNRRARIKNAEFEFIDRAVVFERDGFICGICGEPLDMDAKFPHILSPSLDHVIPLNKGGDHLYSNVQAAHFGCNSGKRDRF